MKYARWRLEFSSHQVQLLRLTERFMAQLCRREGFIIGKRICETSPIRAINGCNWKELSSLAVLLPSFIIKKPTEQLEKWYIKKGKKAMCDLKKSSKRNWGFRLSAGNEWQDWRIPLRLLAYVKTNKQTNEIQTLIKSSERLHVDSTGEKKKKLLEQSKHSSLYTSRKKWVYLFWPINVSSLRQPYQITVQLVTVSIKFTFANVLNNLVIMPGCGSLSGEQEFTQFEMSIGLNTKILAFLTLGVSAWWWKMFQQSKYLLQEDTESKSNSDSLCIDEADGHKCLHCHSRTLGATHHHAYIHIFWKPHVQIEKKTWVVSASHKNEFLCLFIGNRVPMDNVWLWRRWLCYRDAPEKCRAFCPDPRSEEDSGSPRPKRCQAAEVNEIKVSCS